MLLGVLASQISSGRLADEGVRSCTSSFGRKMTGCRVTRPAPQKAEHILAAINDHVKAASKAGRNSNFMM